MGDYSYLLLELVLKQVLAKTYTAYTTYYFDQAYFKDNFEEKNNTTKTPFETEEESYQTVPVFDLLLSKSDSSTQTVTPELMTNDPIQQNILIALQDIQTALGRRNNILLPLFRDNTQDLIEWLDDFERAVTANQYDNEYKFQIVGGYLQGSLATWFSQETNVGAHQKIIRWAPTNARKENTSFTTQRTQSFGEIVTEYAKAIRKLINSEKLSLVASGSFYSSLAGSFPVKVPFKRHIWISFSVVFTVSKSPKIFNNRPVNKLVFPALTTPITISTTTALQMAMKAKNSKKQQQTVTTAIVTPNFFVVPDEIFGKISTAAASLLPDMDDNSSSTSLKMSQDQPLAVLPDKVLSGRSLSILVAKQSINPDNLKDCADQMEIESTVPSPVSGAADGTALSIFGVVTSVKLKSAGLWQYAVVNFKDISSAAAVLSNWSVLVRKDSIRIFFIANQKEVIFSRDAFKAKLFNLLFGCTAFEINLNHLAVDYKKLSPLPLKLPFNIFGGPKNFKPSFVGSKFYAKTTAFVVPSGAGAADMDLDLGGPPKTVTPMLSTVLSASNSAVESRLASLESHLSELSVLIKFLVESVSALVALVTKLLSTPFTMNVLVKKCVDGLAKQNKGLAVVATVMQKRMTHLEKISFKLVGAPPKGESASQPKENPFFAFNLTDNNHNMNELAINTSDLIRKKKNAKINFVLDPNKASTSTANNNESPKAKVFKNSPKLKSPEIVQKSGSYSVVKNLMKTPIHITFGQLMTYLQFKKNLHKSLIPKKKTPKTNKHPCQVKLADNSNVTPLICKAQVAGYFIDLILDSELSKGLSITKAISVCINGISIETDMEVSEAKEYTIIVDNKWLKKAKALLDYELYESDDDESDEKKDQEEQEKTAKLVYIIFTSNGKPLDNIKADKEEIMINDKLICWPYYDILRRTFDRKPGKKAKYSYW
ncbi:hypothetical protein G9A89_007972 [Geosiphon pyriformis]|nr:hypothetical protein G9A89_007972 [Geosiphon pyriformis]